jgi:shikimate dehydrogenase
VLPFLKDIDVMANNIGSVNTLVREEGGYKGYNTDITGLWRAMKSDGVNIEGEEIIVLGAGGVGRAVTFMCASSGAKKVYLLNRNSEKAQKVADEVNTKLATKNVVAMPLYDYVKLVGKGERKYLAIQATSVGLFPNVENAVIEDYDFYKCIKAGYDLIYNPWETMFMQLVKANGGQAFNGLKMLLYQGIDAFELWNGRHVSEESASIIYNQLKKNVRK